ncbi:hypothetical protein GBP346_B0454 [Burkholderia pseudomallei MSHR346]|nr:hypothetical protein GBP346_B0454 [Burkholderia pseudomallei MSHR346]
MSPVFVLRKDRDSIDDLMPASRMFIRIQRLRPADFADRVP